MIAVLCGMDELDKIIDYGKNEKEFLEKEFDITVNRLFVHHKIYAILKKTILSATENYKRII